MYFLPYYCNFAFYACDVKASKSHEEYEFKRVIFRYTWHFGEYDLNVGHLKDLYPCPHNQESTSWSVWYMERERDNEGAYTLTFKT